MGFPFLAVGALRIPGGKVRRQSEQNPSVACPGVCCWLWRLRFMAAARLHEQASPARYPLIITLSLLNNYTVRRHSLPARTQTFPWREIMTSGLKTRVTRFALGLLLAVAGSHAMAAGSLAIDTLQGEKYGFSFNHPSADLADQRSIRECGADCSIVLRFAGQCGAYAADQAKGSNAYGWGTGTTSANTQARAMSECRTKGGSSCKVRAWGCDAIKESSATQGTQPFDQARPQATPQNNNKAPAGFPMLGEWLVDYVSTTGYTANGTLRVTQSLGNGSFQGVLVLGFVNGGESKRVQQDATITVRGNTVTLNASNAVYLLGAGKYNADNYTLTIGSNNLLRGENADAKGAGGAVVISRK
jgi:hypothetical protein